MLNADGRFAQCATTRLVGSCSSSPINHTPCANFSAKRGLFRGFQTLSHVRRRPAVFTVFDPSSGAICKRQPRPSGRPDSAVSTSADGSAALPSGNGVAEAHRTKKDSRFWRRACITFVAASCRYVAIGGNQDGGPKLVLYDLFRPTRPSVSESPPTAQAPLPNGRRFGRCQRRRPPTGGAAGGQVYALARSLPRATVVWWRSTPFERGSEFLRRWLHD